MTEVVVALGAIISILALACKLLINDWFKKSAENEELKKKHADQTQNRLDEELKVLRSIVVTLQETAKILTSRLDRTDIRVDELYLKLSEAIKKVDEFQGATSGVVKNMIKAEFTEIRKQISLAKTGKS